MKALVYEGPKTLNLRDVELPMVERDEVLIEVAFSGICGSELSGYLGHNSLRQPPLIFGHEFSGTVSAVGSSVLNVKVGDRVTANPLVTCGQCFNCKRGRQQLCSERKLLSASLPGSNAEFVKVHHHNVYVLPEGMTFEQGAFTEPVACAVHAVELGNVRPDDDVLILGMGPIGQLILQVLIAGGVKRIVVADMNPHRLQQAKSLGAIGINPKEQDVTEAVRKVTDGRGVNVALDAVGANMTRQTCIKATAMGGTVVFTGLHEAESTLPINDMIRNEIRTVGAFAYSTLHFERAIRFLRDRPIGFTEGVVTAPLVDGKRWFQTLVDNTSDVTKVLLNPKA